MNVVVEDLAPCRKRLRIEVPAKEVDSEYERVAKEFCKMVRLPGFRVGKAPKDVVVKRFEREIEDEVRRSLVPKAVRQAMQDQKLRAVSNPNLEEIHLQRGITMSLAAVVDLAPDIRLPDYKGIPVKSPPMELSDDERTMALNRALEEYADFSPVEGRPLEQGDFAVINFKGTIDGTPVVEVDPSAVSLDSREKMWLKVAPDEFLPGFAIQLVGMQRGEHRPIPVALDESCGHEPLVGKTVSYDVELTDIRTMKLPTLAEYSERNFRNVLPDEQVRDLVGRLAALQKARQVDAFRRRQIVEWLLQHAHFDIPESIREHQTRSIVREIVQENQARGVPIEMLKEKGAEILQAATRNAQDRVKMAFLLLRIAEEEKIQVESKEIAARVYAIAESNKVPPKKLMQDLDEKGALGQIEEELLIGKTLDFLVKHAQIEPLTEPNL